MPAPANQTALFTACSVNYMGKAVAMARSVLEHQADVDVFILLVDRKRPVTVSDARISLLWAEDIGFPGFLRAAFKYNIIELNTALKPHAALFLLQQYENVLYLDPDTFVYSSLLPILTELAHADLLLSPHATQAYRDEWRPGNRDLLQFGAYNLGFFAIRRSENARAALEWWDRQCQSDCFYEPSLGLGVDQKWMDLAPAFFDGVRVTKHPGVNVAFWNLHERDISQSETGQWLVNGDHPLVFFHFSSFDEGDADAIAGKQTRFLPGSRPDFTVLRDSYAAALKEGDALCSASDTGYGFNSMADGIPISAALRRFFAVSSDPRLTAEVDPFRRGGPVYDFARKNRLFARHSASEKHVDFRAEGRFKRQKSILDWGFRLALRILGPDRYFMLLRYLSVNASILKQSDLLH